MSTDNESLVPIVTTKNGTPVTNSILVAKTFDKRHDNVLRDIRSIISSSSKLRSIENMFIDSDYIDSKGNAQPMYIMNRDGFSLLAMGFTGKQALQFKLEFIAAFNEMEARLTLSPEELLLQQAQMLVNQRKQINDIDQRLKAIEYAPSYYTVLGFARTRNVNLPLPFAAKIGRRATTLCKKYGYDVSEVRDPRFGMVNSYPESVLVEAFTQYLVRV